MTAKPVDVLIIGAGINGAGLFRDLCEQGVTCVIVDKGDIGGGTSAAPSRMIHGGLKYLETGQFRLVRESTYERNLLLRNASHVVHPLPTVIPLFSWTRGIGAALRTFLGSTSAPRSRGALLIKAGLMIYDHFGSRGRVMPRHRMLSRRAMRAAVPAMTEEIVGAARYHDAAVTAAERLVLELVQDGLRALPESRAYTWERAVREGGDIRIAEHLYRPRIVINAAGPWIDHVNAELGLETRLIGGTRGSHLLLDHPELVRQLNGEMLYFESDDGRILLAYPYHGLVLAGTTDIPDDDPDRAACTPEEQAYILERLQALLPGLTFEAGQIVHSYSGIRPLPNSEGLPPRLISRDHSAPAQEAEGTRPWPVISLVGGKWTTFRGFAESVADAVLSRLGITRRISTAELPIGGGRDMPADSAARAVWIADVAAESGVDAARVETLLARYGTTARDIAAAEGAGPAEMLDGPAETSAAEIDWIARNEMVRHLEDIILRRTQLALTGRLAPRTLEQIAEVTAEALGWSTERREEELTLTRAALARRHWPGAESAI